MRTADKSPAIELTGKQKNEIYDAVMRAPQGPSLFDLEKDPDVRVFVAHFDGTQNDAKNLDRRYRQTLVATNHEKLRDASPQVLSKYYEGVGTRRNIISGLFESVTGSGCAERAEAALEDLETAIDFWQRKNPNTRVFVHAVGFSRGAASALHFLNLVHERDLDVAMGPQPIGYERPLRTVASSGVLLDTVATGQTSQLDLTVPPSVVSLLHVTAGGEERVFFPLLDISNHKRPNDLVLIARDHDDTPKIHKRTHSVEIPGARHSDVGGSYREGGIGSVSEYLMAVYQTSIGLSMHAHRPTVAEVQGMFAHDSRFVRADWDQQDRQRAKRERRVIPVESTRDAGRSELVTIEAMPSNSSEWVSEATQINLLPPKIGHKDPTISKYAGLGTTLGINFMRSDTDPHGVTYICDMPDTFSIQRGHILCLGEPVAGIPNAAEIRSRLVHNERVRITITREALVPTFNLKPDADHTPIQVTQSIIPRALSDDGAANAQVPQQKGASASDWPSLIQDLVQRLNATPMASEETVRQALLFSMEVAAQDLSHCFPELTSVKFSRDFKGVKIVCMGPDGPFSNRSTSSDLNQHVMLQRLAVMEKAVGAVEAKLRQLPFGLSQPIRHEVNTRRGVHLSLDLDDIDLNVPAHQMKDRHRIPDSRQPAAMGILAGDTVLKNIGSPLLGRSIFQAGRIIRNDLGIGLANKDLDSARRPKPRP